MLFRIFAGIMINFLLIILLAIYDVQGDSTLIAEPGEFKYLVMVMHHIEFLCSGTIVDRRHIITRGSCITGIPGSNLSVITGTTDTKSGLVPFQVGSVHIHYGFKTIHDAMLNEIRWVHDIAVLKLVDQMVWDSFTAPAVLVTREIHSNSVLQCVVPNWRHINIGNKREHYYIRWNGAFTNPDEKCIQSDIRLLKNELCVSWPAIRSRAKNAMNYYNGSPIVYEGVVIGIVDPRGSGTLHTFLHLLPYKDFIENTIDNRKHDVNPGEIDYVVSVWYDYRFKCGGIILHPSNILTTADCVQYANHTRLQIIAGHTQVLVNDPQIQWLSVDKIELHPEYEEILHFYGPKFMHVKNNYAVLTLAVPLKWGPTIGPALLSNTHLVPMNGFCKAYQWHNAYTLDDKVLLQLIWCEEFIMNAEICRGAGIELEADEICVGSQYAQHPKNFHSSGNPVVCDGFVIGIIIPNYSTVPQFSCLTSILSISPLMNSLNNGCYIPPIH